MVPRLTVVMIQRPLACWLEISNTRRYIGQTQPVEVAGAGIHVATLHGNRGGNRHSVMAKTTYTIRTSTPTNQAERPLMGGEQVDA